MTDPRRARCCPAARRPASSRSDFTSAQFRNLDPFGIESALPYLSAGPPALDSLAYAGALAEVQLLGDGNIANAEFDQIFRFWRGGGGSARPPGEWIKIAIAVSQQEGTIHSLSRTARLFALLGMAMADSVPVAWSNKFGFPVLAPWNRNPAGRYGRQSAHRGGRRLGSPKWQPRVVAWNTGSGQSTFARRRLDHPGRILLHRLHPVRRRG